jgi:hypothetical protein
MYKITIADYIYIGSTRDFQQRKSNHKTVCNNTNDRSHNSLVYKQIREAGGWDKCEMIPIEEFDCEGQLQARIREEYWRREYNANLNSFKAYLTEQERVDQQSERNKAHYEANKEKVAERCKAYREANKEKVNERRKAYIETEKLKTIHNCDCGGKYTYLNIRRHEKGKKHLAHLEKQNLALL